MTICTLDAVSAAPHNNIHFNSFRARTLMLGLLLSSVATAAIAQDASPPSPPSNGAIVSGLDQYAAARADQLERYDSPVADRARAAGG